MHRNAHQVVNRLLGSNNSGLSKLLLISSCRHGFSFNNILSPTRTTIPLSNTARRLRSQITAAATPAITVKAAEQPTDSKKTEKSDLLSSKSNTTDVFPSSNSPLPELPPQSNMEYKFYNFLSKYENIIGLTAVKVAQQNTIEMERQFLNAQESRRVRQEDLKRVQMRLKEIHAELDKTSRGEDRYLHLLTEEHKEIKRERLLIEDVKFLEHDERLKFMSLSSYLRESHEKERERAERTKYWSIIGSIFGALIGIIGTTVNNRMRMRDFKSIVTEGSDPAKMSSVIAELNLVVASQQSQIQSFMADVQGILQGGKHSVSLAAPAININEPFVAADESQVLEAIQAQELKLEQEMQDIKRMVAAEHGYREADSDANTLVYVGPEVEKMLADTASDLEAKMKMQTVVAVVAVYAALALAVPVLFLLGGR